ncbi:MAG: dihydroorotate dehydrogenase electron transfer subunit [Candidatus Scalindua sp.]
MSKLFKISIKENKRLTRNYYLLTAHPLKKISKPVPGQFFMLSVDNRLDPLLKRPFSLHRWLGGDFQVLYRVAGKATGILKEKSPGDILEFMGPLGNGFPVMKAQTKIILVAGGLGIAPVFALAEAIAKRNPVLFYGARTKREVLCRNELKSIGINPIVSTDDGTLGKKGTVVDVFNNFLISQFPVLSSYLLYACGPKPMLRTLSILTKKYKLKGYIALEENMACGVGTCLGCVINTRDGFKRVCKEGPVFPVEEVVF